MEPKNRQIAFYEREVNAVLGTPPPLVAVVANLILVAIGVGAILYVTLVPYPITVQSALQITPTVDADTILLHLPADYATAAKLVAVDRQTIIKNTPLFAYQDQQGNHQLINAPQTGTLVVLQSFAAPLLTEQPLGWLIPAQGVDYFSFELTPAELAEVKVGQVVTIYATNNDVHTTGQITRIQTQGEQFTAIIEPRNNTLPAQLDYQMTLTTGQRSIFRYFVPT